MIEIRENVFHIRTESYSYLLEADELGLLRQLHFGAPVRTEDAPAFRASSGLGWGSCVTLVEGRSDTCPDDKPLAFSGSGRGDYRESPLELGGVSTDLRFVSARVEPGTVAMSCPLPQAKGDCESLVITMEQTGLRLRLIFTAFPTALTRRCILENTGSDAVEVTKLMSFSLDLPGNYTMRSFGGGWIAEMRPADTPVTHARVVTESRTGASSHRCNPGFLLFAPDATEESGLVYGCNLVYSGNHYGSAQRSLQGLTRVMGGINPAEFRWPLAPGQSLETPEAVLAVSRRGFGGLSRQMHAFVSRHIIPAHWQERPRPVLYNSWEGLLFDFNHRRLLDLGRRAKDLGCELFVLDDGWFGARNHDRAGLGDYTVNPKKLPQGLEGLSRDLGKLGLEFGLWFEPESVNPDSDLYRAHPEWALTDSFYNVLGRNQLLLDLTKPEVRDYIVENVGSVMDTAGVTYVKWDMNRHSIALGAKAHAFVLGLYEVLDRIFTPRPQVLLESCSSGGNRFDLGMLCFGPQVWCSDDTDPIERLTIQGSLSYLYPQSTFGAHVSAAPHAQTLRVTPLATRANVAFFGCLGYELDLKHLLGIEEKEVKAQTAFYKKYRPVFQFGIFRRLEGGWAVTRDGTTVAGLFQTLVPAAPGYQWLKVPGLDPEKVYKVMSPAQALRVGQFGGLLKHVVPISIDPNGSLLRLADRHYTMSSGGGEWTVSGAALESGILLPPAFRGTGYEEAQRTHADFGSDVFVIEEQP